MCLHFHDLKGQNGPSSAVTFEPFDWHVFNVTPPVVFSSVQPQGPEERDSCRRSVLPER